MANLQKILVATDFSAPSKKALANALELAEKFSAQVDVLYVAPSVAGYAPLDRAIFGEDRTAELSAQMKEGAENGMASFLAAVPGAERAYVGQRIDWGTPYEAVTRVADEGGYGLVVVGSHGWTGAKHVRVGSVAERVVRHAPCPVLVVR